jgi:hypothetical protein
MSSGIWPRRNRSSYLFDALHCRTWGAGRDAAAWLPLSWRKRHSYSSASALVDLLVENDVLRLEQVDHRLHRRHGHARLRVAHSGASLHARVAHDAVDREGKLLRGSAVY